MVERTTFTKAPETITDCYGQRKVSFTAQRRCPIYLNTKSKNITFPENAFKRELLLIVKKYKANLGYAADEMINNFGHQVLRLPPYYCIFNVIELIWAECKTFYNKKIMEKDENAV